MRALLFAGVLASTSTAAAGPCAVHPLAAQSSTADNTQLPPGGGVLVSLGENPDWNAPMQPDLMKTGWVFVDGGKPVAPTIRILAPGLAVFEPPVGTGEIKLLDGKRVVNTVIRAKAKPLLPAPPVTAVHYTTNSIPVGPRQQVRNTVIAQLDGPRPDGAVEIIVFAAGKPTSWTTAFAYAGPKGPLEVWHSPGRCETSIPGLVAVMPKTKVTLAWVDASGRLGAMSKELVVAAKSVP